MLHPVFIYLPLFLVFAFVVLPRVPARRRMLVILGASVVYVGTYDFDYASGLLPGLIVFWGLAEWMDRAEGERRRQRFLLALGLALAVFIFHKYTRLFHAAGNFTLELFGKEPRFFMKRYVMPAGMSYYAFRLLHYLVEVYRGRVKRMGVFEFLHYLIFFPTFAAGPIERAERFAATGDEFDLGGRKEGLRRIVFGLFKSLAVGSVAAELSRPVLASPGGRPAWAVWAAVYGMTAYIYYDFAGYSDVAIGSARLLGYRVMENFDRPYLSTNLAAFWRRWHMSLTYWLRDYIYIPLGGSRVPKYRHYLNYLAVMAACGAWHGSEAHFLAWGVYHGFGLVANDLVRRLVAPRLEGLGVPASALKLAGLFLTFHFVAVGWLLFFFDLDQCLVILRALW